MLTYLGNFLVRFKLVAGIPTLEAQLFVGDLFNIGNRDRVCIGLLVRARTKSDSFANVFRYGDIVVALRRLAIQSGNVTRAGCLVFLPSGGFLWFVLPRLLGWIEGKGCCDTRDSNDGRGRKNYFGVLSPEFHC